MENQLFFIILFRHTQQNVVSAALRAVGNIVTGDDVQTQIVINCAALPCLLKLLSSSKESIRKETCWTISNITAGNRPQIQVMSSSPDQKWQVRQGSFNFWMQKHWYPELFGSRKQKSGEIVFEDGYSFRLKTRLKLPWGIQDYDEITQHCDFNNFYCWHVSGCVIHHSPVSLMVS